MKAAFQDAPTPLFAHQTNKREFQFLSFVCFCFDFNPLASAFPIFKIKGKVFSFHQTNETTILFFFAVVNKSNVFAGNSHRRGFLSQRSDSFGGTSLWLVGRSVVLQFSLNPREPLFYYFYTQMYRPSFSGVHGCKIASHFSDFGPMSQQR